MNLGKYRNSKGDIVLMDIEMPIMNGIDATKIAMKENPQLKVIALTMFTEDDYVQSMIDAGVAGFLVKNINKDTLHKAITTVDGGGNYYSEELFTFFTRKFQAKGENKDGDKVYFTSREKKILQLLSEGLSNKEIAIQFKVRNNIELVCFQHHLFFDNFHFSIN